MPAAIPAIVFWHPAGLQHREVPPVAAQNAFDNFRCSLEPGIEEDGTENRFQGISKNRLAAMPAGLALAAAQNQVFTETQVGGQFCKRSILDQRCT